MAMAAYRRLARLDVSKTAFFVCDIQERFRPLIWRFEDVIGTAKSMCEVAEAFQRPIIVTEQYPKVFKSTVTELQPFVKSAAKPDGAPVMSKMKFSMMTDEVKAHLATVAPTFSTAILFGIEAHACVQQTALDLLADNKDVIIVADGCSSQRPGDRATALQLMQAAGAVVTTSESLMLMLCNAADAPAFKRVSAILKEHNAARTSHKLEDTRDGLGAPAAAGSMA